MYEHIDGDTIVHSTLGSGKDLIIKDQWKREYHFKIASFPVQDPKIIAMMMPEVV